ncbi:hypothetical protein [Stygiolobus caldivivus]|uniref:Uncharacterized protein n=1 Tax=Stygiolobus caldivivus TaxID=2824673 RepID=A0A8D5U8W1_9CREN|nr:hypothetical protein [Stygiolobus caldivivus]BCU71092.1 hypothetical protein KN1_23890 [Stygiolobus caldivivus]
MEKTLVIGAIVIVLFLIAMVMIGVSNYTSHMTSNTGPNMISVKMNKYSLEYVNGYYVLIANITANFNVGKHLNLYGVILNKTYYYAFYENYPVVWLDNGTHVYDIYLSTTNSTPAPYSFKIKPGFYTGKVIMQDDNLSIEVNFVPKSLKPSITIRSATINETNGYYVLTINETSFVPVGHINFYGVSLNGTFYYAYEPAGNNTFYTVVWIDRNGTYNIYLYPTNSTNNTVTLKPYAFTIKPGEYTALFYTSAGNITGEVLVGPSSSTYTDE